MTYQKSIDNNKVRLLSLGMFLLGIPIACLCYSGFLDNSNENLIWRMKYIGSLVWVSWLIRALWERPSNISCKVIWGCSAVWHLQFLPLIFVAFHWFLLYLVASALTMGGYSILLFFRDKPKSNQLANKAAHTNPLPRLESKF